MVDPIRPMTGPLQPPMPPQQQKAPPPAAPEARQEPAAQDNLKLSSTGQAIGSPNVPAASEDFQPDALSFGASVEALSAQAVHATPEQKGELRDRVDELLQEGREVFNQSQTAIRGHMRKLEVLRSTLGDPVTAENTRKTQKMSAQELAAELAKGLRLDETLEKAELLAKQAKEALEHNDGFQHLSGPVNDTRAGLEHLDQATKQLLENMPPQLREAVEQMVDPARALLGAKPGLDELAKALEVDPPAADTAAKTLQALEGIIHVLIGYPDPVGARAQELADIAAAGRRALAGGGR
ncbi:MAG: hypothetical protein JWM80_1648 [Cyanobacteria bacterium RYN_339]|nr:hypothetical protein [Cyanobacteria bacterium RYN_339]